jgi:hypothetical protein
MGPASTISRAGLGSGEARPYASASAFRRIVLRLGVAGRIGSARRTSQARGDSRCRKALNETCSVITVPRSYRRPGNDHAAPPGARRSLSSLDRELDAHALVSPPVLMSANSLMN